MTCRDRSVSEHAENLKGHRERLKERFLNQDARGLPDREMLELLLTYAVPRRDVSVLAEEILRRFGDLKGVIHASTLELTRIKGVSEQIATLICLVAEAGVRCREHNERPPDILGHPKEIERFLTFRFSRMTEEKLLLVFVDQQGVVLGEEMLGAGTVDQVVAFPRQVMAMTLRYNASGLIIAHNHPHGPPLPSHRDREEAERLRDILRPFDVRVKDFIVVGQNRCFSVFRNAPL